MNRKKIALISIIFVIAVLVGYGILSYSEKFTRTTNLSNESIGGIKIHENIKNRGFISQYGKPLRKEDNDLYDYYYWKGGLKTASINYGKHKGSIKRLIIEGTDKKPFANPLHTTKGIKLGDTIEKAISLYGNKYYKSSEQGAYIIGYIDHKENTTLEFWSDEKDIFQIRFDDSSVN